MYTQTWVQACRVCNRLLPNGMPRLSVPVTSHSPPSCGIALSLFSSQSAGRAHCIHCHSLSFPPSLQSDATTLTTHTLRLTFYTHTSTWAASSSLLTNQLQFALSNTTTFLWPFLLSAHCLAHVVRCASAPPLPFPFVWHLTIWWISARLRQGVRHSRIRYKLSLLQGTASHHGSCLHLIYPTPFPLSISCVSTSLSVFRSSSVHKSSLHIF